MRRPFLIRRKLILVLLALAVCGWAAYAETHDIVQQNKHFGQEEMTIKVGDSIKFLNRDTVTHNVFTKSPQFSFSIKQKAGEDKDIPFTVPGDYHIRCAIHPTMKLEVHVLP